MERPLRWAAHVKGSGMIHPNMATMLGFITTDANVEQEAFTACFKGSNESPLIKSQ